MIRPPDITPPLRAVTGPGLPLDRLVIGKRTEDVAELLPRLFSLCRVAQEAGVRAALGQPAQTRGLAAEILRDHLLKVHVTWPALLGLPKRPMPSLDDAYAIAASVFGPAANPPTTASEMRGFLASGLGAASVLAALRDRFAPGEAVAEGLPLPSAQALLGSAPTENSVAARHLDHPAMRAIEASHGRGPLWRACARLYDIDMALDDALPVIETPQPGVAVVPATRGSYALRIAVAEGYVTEFCRITPTDMLLAPAGILDRVLTSLPSDKTGLAQIVLDILDPCSPVRLEPTHA